MSGVPSVVAGVFIYAIFIDSHVIGYSGFAASMALFVLMLPSSDPDDRRGAPGRARADSARHRSPSVPPSGARCARSSCRRHAPG